MSRITILLEQIAALKIAIKELSADYANTFEDINIKRCQIDSLVGEIRVIEANQKRGYSLDLLAASKKSE